jgi:hypothetical protein
MSPRVEMVLWAGSALFILGAVGLWRTPVAAANSAGPVLAMTFAQLPDTNQLQRSARVVIASDPFRITREPSPLPFRPFGDRVAQSQPVPPSPPKPMLLLRGIVGGPPWEALIEGLPGKNGTVVVRSGEKLGDLVIRTIKKDTVVVQGMDTTWRLVMVRTWQ